MSHALVRTNPTGQPFRGRCLKCGEENLVMSDGFKDCPQDHALSDKDALLSILEAEPSEETDK